MPWSNRWPPEPSDSLDTDGILNDVRAALLERDGLVPAGWVPEAFERWDPLRGTPAGGSPQPHPTVANFQYEIQAMLDLVQPFRWWDPNRETLYVLSNLCQDAFGADAWMVDLTATDGQGEPVNRWIPPYARLFEELYRAINRLDRVRILPTVSEARPRDSVYQMTYGITDWPQDRADTFSLFDGEDADVTVSLAYDAGMGGEVSDDGNVQHWTLESREYRMTFATGSLSGYEVSAARLDFSTQAPGGSADFTDTFTAEVLDADDNVLGSFASDDYGEKHITVPAASVSTEGDTVLVIRSSRADSDDRPAWDPSGPNYTSTYREGLAVIGPVRLIVEVNFEYQG